MLGLKCWEVKVSKQADWCVAVFGANSKEARKLFWICIMGGERGKFIDIRMKRVPELDGECTEPCVMDGNHTFREGKTKVSSDNMPEAFWFYPRSRSTANRLKGDIAKGSKRRAAVLADSIKHWDSGSSLESELLLAKLVVRGIKGVEFDSFVAKYPTLDCMTTVLKQME